MFEVTLSPDWMTKWREFRYAGNIWKRMGHSQYTIDFFSIHTAPVKYENATNTSHFGIILRKTR